MRSLILQYDQLSTCPSLESYIGTMHPISTSKIIEGGAVETEVYSLGLGSFLTRAGALQACFSQSKLNCPLKLISSLPLLSGK